jgi:DNA invertase Pin-like site-specific DNA recombinase
VCGHKVAEKRKCRRISDTSKFWTCPARGQSGHLHAGIRGQAAGRSELNVQLEACRDYCEAHGLVVVGEFRDVLSGLNPERPQYQKAVELAKSKQVDKLVVWRLDRLGRDEAEYMTQLRDLRRIGVEVVGVTQPGESILMQHMLFVLAGEEARQLSGRITASKMRRFREGKWGNSAPFGYALQKHPEGGSVLAPSTDAPLTRRRFKLYAEGKTTLRELRDLIAKKRGLRPSAAIDKGRAIRPQSKRCCIFSETLST